MARSTGVRNPPKLLLTKELLMYLFSFLWNEILVLIFNMVIYMQRLAIQFVEMHCTRMHKLFIDQHPGSNCILFIELFTNRHVSAIKKITTVSLFLLLQFDYEIWEIIIYSTTSVFDICSILVSYKESIEVGPLGKLAEICFLLKTTQIWVITIVVVLDQSTVTFQKGWGRGYLQFVWYKPKHSNISKGEGGITICMVLR